MLDFSKDTTTHCSVTIKTSVVEKIDLLVVQQRKNQPKIAGKITRSSVMSLLLEQQMEKLNSET